MTQFREKYGPWALVTGSARHEGIGFGFARGLAAKGLDLVLVDILEEELQARAAELRRDFGVQVHPIPLDLGRDDFLNDLLPALNGIEVSLLVCNHMYTPTHTPPLLEMDLATLDRMLAINARAYTHLVHTFGRQMVARGHGGIILVSSGAGITATPYTTAYSANKGYQRLLGESLWYELRGTGVDILVLTPGLTRTQGDALDGYPKFMLMDVDPVIREALDNLGRKARVVPGPVNKITVFIQTRLSSTEGAINTIGNFMKKGLRKD